MKLATYRDGSRDGQLLVVARDLRTAHYATGIASRMQQVLDDWSFMAPQLQDLYHQLNTGRAPHAFPFDPSQCMAPLPRSYQVLEASAYPSHLADWLPEAASTVRPVVRQASGDNLVGPCDEVVLPSVALGLDMGPGVAVVTGDLPLGTTADAALAGVRLLMLSNSLCLRQWAQAEAGGWAGPQAWLAMAFSPVAVTLDELAASWQGGRLPLRLQTCWNGRTFGASAADDGMAWHWGELLSQLVRTRSLRAGTVVSAGPVSGSGSLLERAAAGRLHAMAQQRAAEQQQGAATLTPYLQWGDSVRVEMQAADGHSVFGAIDLTVVSPQGEGAAA